MTETIENRTMTETIEAEVFVRRMAGPTLDWHAEIHLKEPDIIITGDSDSMEGALNRLRRGVLEDPVPDETFDADHVLPWKRL